MGAPLDLAWWAFIEDVPPRSTPAAWLVGWLPRGRRHVWLARRMDDGSADVALWLIANPTACGLDHRLELTAGDFVSDNVAAGKIAVRLGDERRDYRTPYFRGWMTCVGHAKYAVGLRWPLVWTPPGLIRRAEREGMEIRRCTSS